MKIIKSENDVYMYKTENGYEIQNQRPTNGTQSSLLASTETEAEPIYNEEILWNSKYCDVAQLSENWQDGQKDPLTGDEEESAREFINNKLSEWGIMEDNDNLSTYIAEAWDEWIATDEAASFKK